MQETRKYEIERTVLGIGKIEAEITLHPRRCEGYGLNMNIHYLPPNFGGRGVEDIPVNYDSATMDRYRDRISGSVSIPAGSILINRRKGNFVRGEKWAQLMKSVDQILREVIKRQG